MSFEDATQRIAFVGQGVFFRQCSLELPVAGLEPTFVDFRAGASANALQARLLELDPDVVVIFRPEIVPRGLLSSLRAVRIGYLTEPLPRTKDDGHEDLATRMWWLEQVDPSNFDRIVSFDPLIAGTAERVLPVWRSVALPVADSLFMDVHERARPPRVIFIGRSTEHRENLLAPLKARHELTHIGHGLYGAPLARLLRTADVQLNLHNNPYPSFENRVSIALAAGQLVISEPLSPDHGLAAGEHFLEIRSARELSARVGELVEDPNAFLDVQHAGHERAELFRASAVYPPLIHDALQSGDFSDRMSRRRQGGRAGAARTASMP